MPNHWRIEVQADLICSRQRKRRKRSPQARRHRSPSWRIVWRGLQPASRISAPGLLSIRKSLAGRRERAIRSRAAAHSMVCRSASRTFSIPSICRRPMARRSIKDIGPQPIRPSSDCCAVPASSFSASAPRPSSQARCRSASKIRTILAAARVSLRAARPPLSPTTWFRCRSARRPAARPSYRLRFAAFSASRRALLELIAAESGICGRVSTRWACLPATCAISRRCKRS